MKIFGLVLCVAVVTAAPQADVDDDFELRKWKFQRMYICTNHILFGFFFVG